MASPFSPLARDTVDVIKADGTRHEKVKALVALPMITFFSEAFPIDKGDMLIRHLPHSRTETYLADEVEYIAGMLRTSGHYQVSVRRA